MQLQLRTWLHMPTYLNTLSVEGNDVVKNFLPQQLFRLAPLGAGDHQNPLTAVPQSGSDGEQV